MKLAWTSEIWITALRGPTSQWKRSAAGRAAIGPAIVSPPAIEARLPITASWMTRLPAVFAVISSPSRIDTPDATSVPSVRVKRATAALRCRSPRIGIASSSLSSISCPLSVL